MMTASERYETDIAFRTLVDVFYGYIARAQFTPSELREAAILAAVRYEMRRAVPARIVHAETALEVLDRMEDARYRGPFAEPGHPAKTGRGR